jgi:AcrR family transcriptional regulator
MSSVTETTTRSRKAYDVDAIVDVAVRVFLEHGYDGTSMGDIARAAGIGKSSLYHHVVGKEELLERGIRRALDLLFAVLSEPDAVEGTAVNRLRTVLRRTVEIMTSQPAEVALLLRVRGNTRTERWALERRREFDRRISVMIGEAIAEGAVRADLEPGLLTRLLFGMTNSVIEWYRPDGNLSSGQLVEAIERVVFEGIER